MIAFQHALSLDPEHAGALKALPIYESQSVGLQNADLSSSSLVNGEEDPLAEWALPPSSSSSSSSSSASSSTSSSSSSSPPSSSSKTEGEKGERGGLEEHGEKGEGEEVNEDYFEEEEEEEDDEFADPYVYDEVEGPAQSKLSEERIREVNEQLDEIKKYLESDEGQRESEARVRAKRDRCVLFSFFFLSLPFSLMNEGALIQTSSKPSKQ